MTTQLLLKLYKIRGTTLSDESTAIVYATSEDEALALAGIHPADVALVPFERGVILVGHP